MHDIKAIRNNPEHYREAFSRRGCEASVDTIIDLDVKNRELLKQSQDLQAQKKLISKKIGLLQAEKNTSELTDFMQQVAQIKQLAVDLEAKQGEYAEKIYQCLIEIPNILDKEVPNGKTEDDNIEVRKHGNVPKFDFEPQEHDLLGKKLGMDFETAAKVSGSRFVYLTGPMARLERALGNFMLDKHISEFGYLEVSPPVLVKNAALFGTGQLPKFEEDLFKADEHYLVPTAEVPLTNMVRATILLENKLPLRYTALTPCFRSEAGSAGKDTKGMIRQHQFSKVELVSIVPPEYSDLEQERILTCAETILQDLGLAYRVMLLCSGDTGFSAQKTFDIEVWLPGQDKYREISSISNCGDFQARRMNARYKNKAGTNQFVHTLNGSGLAVGRCLVAILENYQQADGSITIPKVLQPYMGDLEKISL
ncbi:MAG: seryl-tRNA synthetase [Dasania sp.]|jgi:seryl-tRNA synthetase